MERDLGATSSGSEPAAFAGPASSDAAGAATGAGDGWAPRRRMEQLRSASARDRAPRAIEECASEATPQSGRRPRPKKPQPAKAARSWAKWRSGERVRTKKCPKNRLPRPSAHAQSARTFRLVLVASFPLPHSAGQLSSSSVSFPRRHSSFSLRLGRANIMLSSRIANALRTRVRSLSSRCTSWVCLWVGFWRGLCVV